MEKNDLSQNDTLLQQEEWVKPEIKIFNVKEGTLGSPGTGVDVNGLSGQASA